MSCVSDGNGNANGAGWTGSTSLGPLPGEWRLHKAELSKTGEFATGLALGTVTEFVTRCRQAWVFVLLAFEGPRFPSSGTLGHQIGSQSVQQSGP